MDFKNKKVKALVKYILHGVNVFYSFSSKLGESEAREYLNNYSERPCGECTGMNEIHLTHDLQIIIPVYNGKKYIRQCLESVLYQETHYRTLITIVNDGSNDRTDEILLETLRKESKIEVEVINQENKGLSGARNTAMHLLRGKYVFLLDSDDILEKNAIDNMMEVAYALDADILQGSWYDFWDKQREYHIVPQEGVLDDNRGIFSGYPWGKLYKYQVLENFQFPEGYWFEDTPISFILAAMPFKCVSTKKIIYGYRLNPNGITAKSFHNRKSIDTYWITEQCLSEFKKFGVEYDQRAYDYLLRQSIMNYWRTQYQPQIIRESIFVLTAHLMEKYFKKFLTDNKDLKEIEQAFRKKQFVKFEILVRFS